MFNFLFGVFMVLNGMGMVGAIAVFVAVFISEQRYPKVEYRLARVCFYPWAENVILFILFLYILSFLALMWLLDYISLL